MKKNFIASLVVFICFSATLFNCTKRSNESDESQGISSLSYSNDSVLNFIPSKISSSGSRSKTPEYPIINGTSSGGRVADNSSARSTACGGNFSNSYG